MSNVLSPQMVEALHNNVDLRLGWAYHGKMFDPIERRQGGMLYNLGPAVLGVADADFAVVHDLVDPLQPGDLFCRESYDGRPADPPAMTVSNLDTTLRRSIFVGERNAPTRAIDGDTRTSIVEAICTQDDPDRVDLVAGNPAHAAAVLKGAELVRTYQLVSPLVGYADSLAVAKGVRVQVADSSPQRYAIKSERIKLGNIDMARALGGAAVAMESTGSSRKPVLAFAAGKNHKGVEKILQDAGIPFTSQESSQPVSYKLRRELAILGGQAFSIGFSKQWEANANRNYLAHHE